LAAVVAKRVQIGDHPAVVRGWRAELARLVGGEHVALACPEHAMVQDARRQRLGEPYGERTQRARHRGCGQLVEVGRENVRANDRHSSMVVDHQASRPETAEEDRPEPVRRQVDPEAVARIEHQLVDEEIRGL
jgi:hypothetical protein